MKPIEIRLEELKNNGYDLDFSTVFENTFENYKKIAIYAGLMLFVFLVFFFGILILLAIAFFGIALVSETLRPENLKPETFTGNVLLTYTAFVTILTCILSPFQAGFLKMADCAEKGEEFRVSTIFEYYKFPYFGTIFLTTLFLSMCSAGLSQLFILLGVPNLSTLTSLSLSLFSFLAIPLIIFGKLNAFQAIKSSVSIISKQPFTIVALIIVTFILSLTGLIGFCAGIFFTLPIMYSLQYSIYKSIVGIDHKSEIDQIAANEEENHI